MGIQQHAERFEPATVDEWSTWLAANHDRGVGVWLVTPKASAGCTTINYEDSVIEALRFGWVDSTQKSVDDERSMLWFAPRRRGSLWTRPNKLRIAKLEAEGRLETAGAAAVAAARANGNWTLLDQVEDRIVPEDLASALAARPGAREQWDGFPPSAQKLMLTWIVTAKRSETRAARVAEVAARAAVGERARR